MSSHGRGRGVALLTLAGTLLLFPALLRGDEIVVFMNGRSLRVDQCVPDRESYRLTTMTGGVMEVPQQLVKARIPCEVDKEVVEQHGGTSPTGGAPTGGAAGAKNIPPRIPPPAGARRGGPAGLGGGPAGGKIPLGGTRMQPGMGAPAKTGPGAGTGKPPAGGNKGTAPES